MVASAGIGGRVQGMRRYYALLLITGARVRLVKALDGDVVLAETGFSWHFDVTYELNLKVRGNRLRASIDGEEIFDVEDEDRPLMSGAVALVCEEGRTESEVVRVRPLGGGLERKLVERRERSKRVRDDDTAELPRQGWNAGDGGVLPTRKTGEALRRRRGRS
jgi:hypothetical protein